MLSPSLLLAALAPAAAPQVWTVDDDGPAETSLLLDGIPGLAVLDDCHLGTPGANQATLDVRNCASVVLTRCSVQGAPNSAWRSPESGAVQAWFPGVAGAIGPGLSLSSNPCSIVVR